MSWLGLGKKNRFTNRVIEEMYGLFEHYGVQKDNETVRNVNSQAKAGERNDATFHNLLMIGFHLVIKDHLDDMLKAKWTPRQGAIWCFASYIINTHNAGNLEKMSEEEPDLYLALDVIWFICAHHLKSDASKYGPCIPPVLSYPFPQNIPAIKKDFGF